MTRNSLIFEFYTNLLTYFILFYFYLVLLIGIWNREKLYYFMIYYITYRL